MGFFDKGFPDIRPFRISVFSKLVVSFRAKDSIFPTNCHFETPKSQKFGLKLSFEILKALFGFSDTFLMIFDTVSLEIFWKILAKSLIFKVWASKIDFWEFQELYSDLEINFNSFLTHSFQIFHQLQKFGSKIEFRDFKNHIRIFRLILILFDNSPEIFWKSHTWREDSKNGSPADQIFVGLKYV